MIKKSEVMQLLINACLRDMEQHLTIVIAMVKSNYYM